MQKIVHTNIYLIKLFIYNKTVMINITDFYDQE